MNSSTSGWVILIRKLVAGFHPQNDTNLECSARGIQSALTGNMNYAWVGLALIIGNPAKRDGHIVETVTDSAAQSRSRCARDSVALLWVAGQRVNLLLALSPPALQIDSPPGSRSFALRKPR